MFRAAVELAAVAIACFAATFLLTSCAALGKPIKVEPVSFAHPVEIQAGKDAPISASYQDPVDWSTECLVHALAHRLGVQSVMDPSRKAMIEADVVELTRGGYPLLQPLYLLLADFEKSNLPFDQYLPSLLHNLPEYRH